MITDDPRHPDVQRGGPDESPVPQHKAYLVLSDAERAKGFVRPVRRSYRHVGQRPRYALRDLTAEELERYADCGYVKFEPYPESDRPSLGRFWTQQDLDNHGCGTVTTMGLALCETYARKPDFYGSTYCVHCSMHRPVAEFIWIESDGSDGPVVGS